MDTIQLPYGAIPLPELYDEAARLELNDAILGKKTHWNFQSINHLNGYPTGWYRSYSISHGHDETVYMNAHTYASFVSRGQMSAAEHAWCIDNATYMQPSFKEIPYDKYEGNPVNQKPKPKRLSRVDKLQALWERHYGRRKPEPQ